MAPAGSRKPLPLVVQWRHAFLSANGPTLTTGKRAGRPDGMTRLLLCYISTAMHSDGSSFFESYGTIAEKTGIDLKTVKRLVKRAASLGWLDFTPGRPGRPSVYKPTFPIGMGAHGPQEMEGDGGAQTPRDHGDGGTQSADMGRGSAHGGTQSAFGGPPPTDVGVTGFDWKNTGYGSASAKTTNGNSTTTAAEWLAGQDGKTRDEITSAIDKRVREVPGKVRSARFLNAVRRQVYADYGMPPELEMAS